MYSLFCQAEDGIRDIGMTGVQTCALPISLHRLLNDLLDAWEDTGIYEFILLTAHGHDPHQEALATVITTDARVRSEERRVGKSVDLGGRRIIKKKKMGRSDKVGTAMMTGG